MRKAQQSALQRYMARRGAPPAPAPDRRPFTHWRWVRLAVLTVLLASTYALVGRPRIAEPVKLTY